MFPSSSITFQPISSSGQITNKSKLSRVPKLSKELTLKQIPKKKTSFSGQTRNLENFTLSPTSSSTEMVAIVEPWDCPLCMEQVDFGDINFVPCECGYQVCRFCWHHIKSVLNDQCPACRRSYTEQIDSPFVCTQSALASKTIIAGKKKKNTSANLSGDPIIALDSNGTRGGAPLGNVLASRKHLIDVRVLQSNLVYVVGVPLSFSLYNFEAGIEPKGPNSIFAPSFIMVLEDLLCTKKYFGKYGSIIKLVINVKGHHSGTNTTKKSGSSYPTVSAFLTFERPDDAAIAIDKIDNSTLEGYPLRATYGTTKYCAFFLRGQLCPNQTNCLYLHELGQSQNSYTKETLSHRQRDISLKRLFGCNTQPSSESQQEVASSILKDPKQSSNQHPNIENFNLIDNDSELPITNMMNSLLSDLQNIDVNSFLQLDEYNSGLLETEDKTSELSKISSLASRSSSRFAFVAEKQIEADITEVSKLESNFPASNLFEAFEVPFSPPLEEDIFSCNSTLSAPWFPFNHLDNFSLMPDSFEKAFDSTKFRSLNSIGNEFLTTSKLQIPSYSEAAKSGPSSSLNMPSQLLSEQIGKKIIDHKQSALSFPSKLSSNKKSQEVMQKASRLKHTQSSVAVIPSTPSCRKETSDQKSGKSNSWSANHELQQPKSSNPFMFLLEDDSIIASDTHDLSQSTVSSKSLFPSNSSSQKLSNMPKNSKKKKKSNVRKENTDQQLTNSFETLSTEPTDSVNANSLSESGNHILSIINSGFLKSFTTVISIFEKFIMASNQNVLDDTKFHYIEPQNGKLFTLDSLYNSIETLDENLLTQFLTTIINEVKQYSSDFDPLIVSTLLSDLNEFDSLSSTYSSSSPELQSFNHLHPVFNNLMPNHNNIYSSDIISGDMELYDHPFSSFLYSLFSPTGPFASIDCTSATSFSSRIENEFSTLRSAKEKLQRTIKSNYLFSGKLID